MSSVRSEAQVGGSSVNNSSKGIDYLGRINAALGKDSDAATYKYTERDVILYNLGVGATRHELSLVFERAANFSVLPTFGVVPTYHAPQAGNLNELLPNFDMRKLLHGEQYLEILQYPIPTSATLVSQTRLLEFVDKGNAAVVRRCTTTTDTATGKPVFYNEGVSFVRGAGGFGGKRTPSDRGAATAANIVPSSRPDAVREEKTAENLAAIYRLSGDLNPLHIDPDNAAVGGFKDPILHGLATFGISGKHVFQQFGPFKNIKVRFVGTVIPGETLVTEMWKVSKVKVVFQVRVKETGKLAIGNAAVELLPTGATPSL